MTELSVGGPTGPPGADPSREDTDEDTDRVDRDGADADVTVLYADTSALARAYLADEPDHEALRARLLDGPGPVVTSELTRVELASAVHAAVRGRRLEDAAPLLARVDADCGDNGPLTLLRLDPTTALPAAYGLLAVHPLRTLDAVHLAVALTDARAVAGDDPLVLVTRDARQAAAARAEGLPVE